MTLDNLLIDQLNRIRIVMIGTTLPANIGSAARAMHTMGLSDLVVVNPRLPIDETSFANAAGATAVLDGAVIAQNIDEALVDCTLVLAASARSRQIPKPIITPHIAGQIINQHTTNNPKGKIAILFGREDRGLTNDELALANYHIQIPANPAYPVLNVASAVQVIAASIFAELSQQADSPAVISTKQTQGVAQDEHQLDIVVRSQWDEPAITREQAQKLDEQILDLMKQLNLAQDEHLRLLPHRLARLTQRLQLDQKEYALMRALLAKIKQNIRPKT